MFAYILAIFVYLLRFVGNYYDDDDIYMIIVLKIVNNRCPSFLVSSVKNHLSDDLITSLPTLGMSLHSFSLARDCSQWTAVAPAAKVIRVNRLTRVWPGLEL